jgi:3',5'-cyclic AMP phosphodiesterase CpdA
MRLGWVTDLHLNFVSSPKRTEFYAQLCRRSLQGLLLGGDIGEADCVTTFLAEIAYELSIPIYFVLGNHDFYRGTIAGVRARVARKASESPLMHWLNSSGVISLTENTALIGHDSWADGRLGDFFRSDVMLNDYFLIGELSGLEKQERYRRLNALGDEAAEFIAQRALEALERHKNVIVLTHVPPFRESCWHEGKISNDDYLPHFACRAVGDRLAALMRAHPDHAMTVLCGHTHSPGTARILDNLEVRTGGAQYGAPALQEVLEIE